MKIAILGNVHSDGWKVLKEKKFKCFEVTNFDENNLKVQLGDVDAILLRTSNLNASILSNCKNIKIIARHGVGYDNVDLDYLNKNKPEEVIHYNDTIKVRANWVIRERI